MRAPVLVQVIASPVACATGVTERWREASDWVAQNLAGHFGDTIVFKYYDLFDPDSPALPPGAALPVVLVDGQVLSSGSKLSAPAIRKRVEAILAVG